MDVGVGLPTTIPGVDGGQIVEWARRAEQCGFSSLGVLDRLVYDSYEPLVALAAAAAVTERIGLATTILIAAYRGNTALLAKQLASLDRLSRGRLVVGVAAGGREDDFAVSGVPYSGRGRRLDGMLSEMRQVWTGVGCATIGPRPPRSGPPILVGGHSPAAMRRAAVYGHGWIAGGSSATSYATLVRRVRAAWSAEARSDDPRMVALTYVALGPGARAQAERYLRHYYAFIGVKAQLAAESVIADPGRLRDVVAAYAAAGCDELILFPCVADPRQAQMIAEAVR
jgi:alkanesulfonate monooxygenase SsuD/methylene tetrahydromethanopterin reductase-like flavin-dependent oxidoreductase (luciferase family)